MKFQWLHSSCTLEAAVQAVIRADRAAAEATKACIRETDRQGVNERESQRWAEEQARLNHELFLAQRHFFKKIISLNLIENAMRH